MKAICALLLALAAGVSNARGDEKSVEWIVIPFPIHSPSAAATFHGSALARGVADPDDDIAQRRGRQVDDAFAAIADHVEAVITVGDDAAAERRRKLHHGVPQDCQMGIGKNTFSHPS